MEANEEQCARLSQVYFLWHYSELNDVCCTLTTVCYLEQTVVYNAHHSAQSSFAFDRHNVQVRRTPHSPLALLSVDLGADGCNLDGIVGEVNVVVLPV